ncbi:GNAT family N-acetyltransferase [Roseobacter sp. YSTF-M11]|uniref:GNAT family N-acetyltransferase n=1 Tax=Roseobacter insulae TaxID=2859783 RepID=A0A9X1FVV9_9RHOB|nr:GNAT family N-acetyltransferase [Roseobacter insulae]MBW4709025.1 GNAT family N-acetyltransferase [Roseobacter insulae]
MDAAFIRLSHKPEPLDRPVWAALKTRHTGFAETDGPACAYSEDVAPFGAVDPTAPETQSCLERLTRRRMNGIVFMQSDVVQVPAGLACTREAAGVQMILAQPVAAGEAGMISRLTPGDVAEMLGLVARAEPGPFAARTHLLGAYWGIRRGGRLVAMAGERLRLPGYCEISAVCVHPAYQGQGFARRLVMHVARGIVARGETPILHTYADNHAAIALYHHLGFRVSRQMHIVTLVHADARATAPLPPG